MKRSKYETNIKSDGRIQSVKSLLPCFTVIQTNYDILKANGGELTVESNDVEGSVFTIHLKT